MNAEQPSWYLAGTHCKKDEAQTDQLELKWLWSKMAESPNLCTSGPSEEGLDAEGLAASGNQHSELTHEPCQELDRHFKEEPDQSKEPCRALAVNPELGDIEEELMVEDPKELSKKFREELSHRVYESRDSEPEPESQGCQWSLYFPSCRHCRYQRSGGVPAPSLESPPRQMLYFSPRISLLTYHHKILSARSKFLEPRKALEEQESPGLPETLKDLEELQTSSGYL